MRLNIGLSLPIYDLQCCQPWRMCVSKIFFRFLLIVYPTLLILN